MFNWVILANIKVYLFLCLIYLLTICFVVVGKQKKQFKDINMGYERVGQLIFNVFWHFIQRMIHLFTWAQFKTLVRSYSLLYTIWVEHPGWLASDSPLAELWAQRLPWEKCCYNDADWQFSLKPMRGGFLPLLTPVVFTARLCSGRLRLESGGRRVEGALKIYDPPVPSSDTQSVELSLCSVTRHVALGLKTDCVRATATRVIFTGTVSMSRNWSP